MADFASTTINSGGWEVGLLETGPEGAPPVVFAHCSLAHAGLWKGVMAELANRWRCISVDMPAHGRSAPGDEARSLQLQAVDYVLDVIAQKAGGAAHLVGLSFGAAVMGRVAVRAPERTKSLTLIEPVYFHLLDERDEEAAKANRNSMIPVFTACEEGRFDLAAAAFMDAWGQKGQFDRMPERAQKAVMFSLSHLARDFNMVSERPKGQITGEEIAASRAPLLLMEGERTHPAATAVQDRLMELRPDAARFVVPGAGHLSPVDDAKAVARRIAEHLTVAEG